jgi:eukaryotic-like serine/threonine-protein kinase
MEHRGDLREQELTLKEGQNIENEGPKDDLLGKVVGDRYRIVEFVGGGGFGRVYRAMHLELNQEVAIKVLHAGFVFDEVTFRRFRQEGTLLSSVTHPNLCRVLDFFVLTDGRPTLVMEFVRGVSLSKLLETGPLPLSSCLNLGIELSRAMCAAHSAGLVHRDIKPCNILVQDEAVCSVKLLDFGLAKIVDGKPSRSLTETGTMVGTPGYMSPEQCLGQPVDARSDIYSIACVIYEAACGRPAFSGSSFYEVMNAHLKQSPPKLVTQMHGLKQSEEAMVKQLSILVEKCLETEPEQRYQSAEVLSSDFEAIKAGQAIQGKRRFKKAFSKFSLSVFVACIGTISVIAAAIFYLQFQSSPVSTDPSGTGAASVTGGGPAASDQQQIEELSKKFFPNPEVRKWVSDYAKLTLFKDQTEAYQLFQSGKHLDAAYRCLATVQALQEELKRLGAFRKSRKDRDDRANIKYAIRSIEAIMYESMGLAGESFLRGKHYEQAMAQFEKSVPYFRSLVVDEHWAHPALHKNYRQYIEALRQAKHEQKANEVEADYSKVVEAVRKLGVSK